MPLTRTNYFGIISEGNTDYPVLKHMLCGLFSALDPDIDQKIIPIRPKEGESFGWERLLNYLALDPSEFEQVLQTCEYLIIQIDTDIAHKLGITAHNYRLIQDKYPKNIINKFKSLIILDKIKTQRFKLYYRRIFFAVCVDSLECWLLPFYSQNQRILLNPNNCLHSLNKEIKRNSRFSKIDLADKKARDYEKISSCCSDIKNRNLRSLFDRNPSLKIFVEQLERSVSIEPSAPERF